MELLVHRGGFWKWRLLGSFVTLADELTRRRGSYDVVFASSMLHLPAFLGAARSAIGEVPIAVYFHESQFGYPTSPLDRRDESHGFVNWASAAAADLVVFNSAYHRDAFLAGAARLLRRFPDHRQDHLVSGVAERSAVLPVGVDLARLDLARSDSAAPYRAGERSDAPVVLWNHRWEHDKAPDRFADAVIEVAGRGLDFELVLAGERFVNDPPELELLRRELGHRISYDGHAPGGVYPALLARSDVVVSTAVQEFFGVAVTEAVYAGAFPVVPDRLVYPERIPKRFHDVCLYDGDSQLVERMVAALVDAGMRKTVAAELRSSMAVFDWGQVAPRYDRALEGLVSRSR